MDSSRLNIHLLSDIQSSPTPFHVVSVMSRLLLEQGFKRLQEQDDWGKLDGHYFVTRNASSIIAFQTTPEDIENNGIHLAGAHTDSPCLKVKPNPVINKQGYVQLGVEVYGGALLNPWFDRDLSLAGRVTFRNKDGAIQSVLIDFQRPVAVIPSLAIHLDPNANQKRSINAQTDIVPVLLQQDKDEKKDFHLILQDQIQAQHGNVSVDKVLDYELSLYDAQAPSVIGLHEDFISGARLDNLLSCFIGLRALLDADTGPASLLVCNDHEEVGSISSSGAQGPFLRSVLQRLAGPGEQLSRLIDRSMMVSCDNAHGIHPNYSHRHDSNHGPMLNKGPVIKINANQRYASNSETGAYFRQLCEETNVPVQDFVMRNDMRCGSTIGPITAAEIGVKTVDVGIPQLAMHSIRETCGSRDTFYLYRVLRHYFSTVC